MISGPFIITERGYWVVGPDVTQNGGWIASERSGLTTPPRSGWKDANGTCGADCWFSDNTLLFLPGGPEIESPDLIFN